MVFFYNGKEYVAQSAIEIVREMALDANWRPLQGDLIRGFLRCELAGLYDRIHIRDLDLARHYSEEMLAFNYLCLLDEYGIGDLHISANDRQSKPEVSR
jgi:hypothetical protein